MAAEGTMTIGPAARSMLGSKDQWAAIRRLNLTRGTQMLEVRPGEYEPHESYFADLTSPELQPYAGKYSGARDLGDGRVVYSFQQPGKHKYDTMDAVYAQDQTTGQWMLQGDPTPTRQVSSREHHRDFIEQDVLPMLAAAGLAYGAAYGAGALGGGGAGAAEAGALGGGAEASALAGEAAGAYGGEAALGSAAGVTGGSGLGTVGTIQEAGALSQIPAVGAGIPGGSIMGASDWIELAKLGAGLYAIDQAGDRADEATGRAGDAANRQLDLSQQAFDWFKKAYDDQTPTRQAAEKRAQDVSDALLEGMRFATGQAKELDEYNKATFRPAEKAYMERAMGYDTPERRAAAAAAAGADVDSSMALARQAIDRAAARSGVTPGSAKHIAAMEDSALKQATARGGAMTRAMRDVEQQGFARLADATNLGRGIATQQATQQQIASGTGGQSVNASMAGVQASMAGNPTMQAGFNTALTGSNAAGNLYSQLARNQIAQDQMYLDGISSIGKFFGGSGG